jgi:Cu(I)/Ag(I) efflux system protein CusF
MKTQTALCVAVVLAASLPQPSSADNTKAASAHEQTTTAAAGTRASATGTIKTIDATAGKIAISHGPVAVLKWPAMTMTFNATPAQVAAVHVGQKVEFEFVSRGMDATLMRISPLK